MKAVCKSSMQYLGRRSLFQQTKTQIRRFGLSKSTVVGFNGNESRKSRQRVFSSVSDEEVVKFAKLSESWWDPQQNPLIGMNSVRVKYIVDQICDTSRSAEVNTHDGRLPPLSGLKAVDVGCGGGLLSESLARLGADVVGVDPSQALIEHAQYHSQMDPRTRSIDYRGGYTIEKLAKEVADPCFDIICILEVIEHVKDVESILESAKTLLKPNTGRLFLSTMNRTIKSQIVAIIGAEYIMRYLPIGTHDWDRFLSPQEVELLMNRAGLQQIDVQGMVIDKPPFQGCWDWKLDREDTDINWIGTYIAA